MGNIEERRTDFSKDSPHPPPQKEAENVKQILKPPTKILNTDVKISEEKKKETKPPRTTLLDPKVTSSVNQASMIWKLRNELSSMQLSVVSLKSSLVECETSKYNLMKEKENEIEIL